MAKTPSVFIDGEAGTTGLQIRERLAANPHVALRSIDADRALSPCGTLRSVGTVRARGPLRTLYAGRPCHPAPERARDRGGSRGSGVERTDHSRFRSPAGPVDDGAGVGRKRSRPRSGAVRDTTDTTDPTARR